MNIDNFNHPCKETCSGWKQGFDDGYELGKKDQQRVMNQFDWECNLVGDNCQTLIMKQCPPILKIPICQPIRLSFSDDVPSNDEHKYEAWFQICKNYERKTATYLSIRTLKALKNIREKENEEK